MHLIIYQNVREQGKVRCFEQLGRMWGFLLWWWFVLIRPLAGPVQYNFKVFQSTHICCHWQILKAKTNLYKNLLQNNIGIANHLWPLRANLFRPQTGVEVFPSMYRTGFEFLFCLPHVPISPSFQSNLRYKHKSGPFPSEPQVPTLVGLHPLSSPTELFVFLVFLKFTLSIFNSKANSLSSPSKSLGQPSGEPTKPAAITL